jgi:hypothetical protein
VVAPGRGTRDPNNLKIMETYKNPTSKQGLERTNPFFEKPLGIEKALIGANERPPKSKPFFDIKSLLFIVFSLI